MYMLDKNPHGSINVRARHPHGSDCVNVPDIHMDQTMNTCQTSTWIKLCTCSRHPHGSDYVHVPEIHMDQTMYMFQTSTWIRLCRCQTFAWIRLYVSDIMTSGFLDIQMDDWHLNMSGIHTDQKRLAKSDIHMDHTNIRSDLRLDMSERCLDVSRTQMHKSVRHPQRSDWSMDVS